VINRSLKIKTKKMEQTNLEPIEEIAPQKQVFGEDFAYIAIAAIVLTTYTAINLSLFIV
jgi:hypothetical protein